MRTLRTLAAGAALLGGLPTIALAQNARDFENSWFWGAKVGNMTFWTTQVAHAQAPVIGAEWLITRQRGGLYVSFDQEFFNQKSTYTIYDFDAAGKSTRIGDAAARIDGMHRLTVAAMGFPGAAVHGIMRPYFGLGFALSMISTAQQISGPYTEFSSSLLKEQASRGAPIAIAGLQAQYRRFSLFGQGSYMPAQRHFLLNNNETYFLEAGLRVNAGSSIEGR